MSVTSQDWLTIVLVCYNGVSGEHGIRVVFVSYNGVSDRRGSNLAFEKESDMINKILLKVLRNFFFFLFVEVRCNLPAVQL